MKKYLLVLLSVLLLLGGCKKTEDSASAEKGTAITASYGEVFSVGDFSYQVADVLSEDTIPAATKLYTPEKGTYMLVMLYVRNDTDSPLAFSEAIGSVALSYKEAAADAVLYSPVGDLSDELMQYMEYDKAENLLDSANEDGVCMLEGGKAYYIVYAFDVPREVPEAEDTFLVVYRWNGDKTDFTNVCFASLHS